MDIRMFPYAMEARLIGMLSKCKAARTQKVRVSSDSKGEKTTNIDKPLVGSSNPCQGV